MWRNRQLDAEDDEDPYNAPTKVGAMATSAEGIPRVYEDFNDDDTRLSASALFGDVPAQQSGGTMVMKHPFVAPRPPSDRPVAAPAPAPAPPLPAPRTPVPP